jgi:nondiscriminating aspartyl-tRNA synthetase
MKGVRMPNSLLSGTVPPASPYHPVTLAFLENWFHTHPEDMVAVRGAVHRIRRMSGFSFLILRTSRELIQCVADADVIVANGDSYSGKDLCEGCTVEVSGLVHIDPKSRSGPEIQLKTVKILSVPAAEMPFVLGKKVLDISQDTNLDYRSIALRHPIERAVFRIQEGIGRSFREYFTAQHFTEIHTPKIVFAGAEGGANIFRLDYFGREVYLAQSPQFYKQAMVGVFDRVFEIGAVYRAEKHSTSRHLNEYIGLDMEMGYVNSFEDLMQIETGWLQRMVSLLSEDCMPELAMLHAKLPDLRNGIPSIRFGDAKMLAAKVLRKSGEDERDDLSPDEEQAVCAAVFKETGCEFVFVTHYPTSKRPFYAMEDPESPDVTLSFDLLFRGLEVTTGGQRIHDYAGQVAKMEHRGMNPELFETYLQIHKYGMPPHGGFGAGLERLTMKLLDLPNIRQASLYPRDITRVTP